MLKYMFRINKYLSRIVFCVSFLADLREAWGSEELLWRSGSVQAERAQQQHAAVDFVPRLIRKNCHLILCFSFCLLLLIYQKGCYLFFKIEEIIGLIDEEDLQRWAPQVVTPEVNFSDLRQRPFEVVALSFSRTKGGHFTGRRLLADPHHLFSSPSSFSGLLS